MFRTERIDLASTGALSRLVLDYLRRHPGTTDLYEHFPDIEGFRQLLEKKPYQSIDRGTLHASLTAQAARVSNTPAAALHNIDLLKKENTFTVTTGHQLCLFTGPLYFIYKIASAVSLARSLNKAFTGAAFVPVFWMASEDHDFAEINHFHAAGRTFKWQTGQSGAVGRFSTAGLAMVAEEMESAFGHGERALELTTLFRNAYLQHENLADATRYLVNALFGEGGVVIIDGDDKALKALYRPWFAMDILEQRLQAPVSETSGELASRGYSVQVNPRPVNCFLLENDSRERIDADGTDFVAGAKRISRAEMEAMIRDSPASLSPNVITRPLYQQVILPNVSYIGGPGEIAYWLELRRMFAQAGVQFPVLTPRTFATVIEEKADDALGKLDVPPEILFRGEQEAFRHVLTGKGDAADLSAEKEALASLFEKLTENVKKIDQTLEASALSAAKRSLRLVDALEEKGNRAYRRRSSDLLNRIKSVRSHLYPNGVPQERFENFSTFYLHYGAGFLVETMQSADPLDLTHLLLRGSATQ